MKRKYEVICESFPNLDDIRLINESNLDPSRKTYLAEDFIIKSCKIDENKTAHLRINDLKKEYDILKSCEGLKGIPKSYHFCKNDSYEIMILNPLSGVQLIYLNLSFTQLVKVVFRVSKILLRLSIYRISHNDVIPENILITKNSNVSLIDFDQSTRTSVVKAILGNFLGIKTGNSKVTYSIITILKDYLRKRFPKLIFTINKLSGREVDDDLNKLPPVDKESNPKLFWLVEAWKTAQKSNASSPGIPIAYYSMDFNEVRLPGERFWLDRWNRLRSISDYSNKTIIELGCNMGLLSTYLLKEANAKKCIGVDSDEKILKSAAMISEVFGVKPEFINIHLNSDKEWEKKLLDYKADIIFVLNVLNWVKKKERLLSFMSQFQEVIFEGHDLPQIERERIASLGFTDIEELGYRERQRIILRCRK